MSSAKDHNYWASKDHDLYEDVVRRGIAAADRRGGAVDHVTARRIALRLLAQPEQPPDFARCLSKFAESGFISQELKRQLRIRAWKPGHAQGSETVRLLQYAAARGKNTGPISRDFAAICEQFERSEAMLSGIRDRVQQTRQPIPEPTWPDADGPQVTALAHYDRRTHTVTLVLDPTTANTAIYALAAHAADREAHAREVQQTIQAFPAGSHARANRRAIAARETRITTRLRAIEHAYQAALGFQGSPSLKPPDITSPTRRSPDREPELE
jgi:hypothetical protein